VSGPRQASSLPAAAGGSTHVIHGAPHHRGGLARLHGPLASTFHVFIQLGAILASVWMCRRTFFDVLRRAHREPGPRRFVRNIIIATIPAGIVGFLAYDWIMEHLFSPVTVAGALIVGGLIILLIEWWGPRAGCLAWRGLRDGLRGTACAVRPRPAACRCPVGPRDRQ
jgi:hypothetical protein